MAKAAAGESLDASVIDDAEVSPSRRLRPSAVTVWDLAMHQPGLFIDLFRVVIATLLVAAFFVMLSKR
jgi:hypothetical protein